MKKTLLIPGLALALVIASCGETTTEKRDVDSVDTEVTRVDDDNAEFVKEAAVGGMMEVELSKVAADKATSTEVKNFAQMIVKDHSGANDELKALAAQKNIEIPAQLPEDKRDDIDDLKEKTGKDFDEKYIAMMVDDHQEDVDKFEKMANKDEADPDLKSFAAKTLPTLKEHLNKAKAIKDKH